MQGRRTGWFPGAPPRGVAVLHASPWAFAPRLRAPRRSVTVTARGGRWRCVSVRPLGTRREPAAQNVLALQEPEWSLLVAPSSLLNALINIDFILYLSDLNVRWLTGFV